MERETVERVQECLHHHDCDCHLKDEGCLSSRVQGIREQVEYILGNPDGYDGRVLLGTGWCKDLLTHITLLEPVVTAARYYATGRGGKTALLNALTTLNTAQEKSNEGT